jgi:NADH-quinone oxidoreductase subunit C
VKTFDPDEVRDALGELVVVTGDAYGLTTVDIAAPHWTEALTAVRDGLGCGFFDWLTGVDELDHGFAVVVHVARLADTRRLMLRTRIPKQDPRLASVVNVYAGASWHERETHEMFGIGFDGHPGLNPLLLPDGFEGHPLRKDFVLASRVAKAWPGAKEPGESDNAPATGRRRMLPPGVPEPGTWGPDKAPAVAEEEPAAKRAERPRRSRSVSQGSTSQQTPPELSPPDQA